MVDVTFIECLHSLGYEQMDSNPFINVYMMDMANIKN